MTSADDHLLWPDVLDTFVASSPTFTRAVVVNETDSTQDALARLDPEPGALLVSGRQTGGRGRQGRIWADDGGAGLAISFAVSAAPAALLCCRAAIALNNAFAPLLAARGIRSGLKWPNDYLALLDGPRKLAGILIEQEGDRAIIGVGINVLARTWPPELSGSAASLEDAGLSLSRLDALLRFLVSWDEVVVMSERSLGEAYHEADLLRGCRATFLENGGLHEGLVVGTDPFSGVELRTSAGTVLMRPDLASLESWEPR